MKKKNIKWSYSTLSNTECCAHFSEFNVFVQTALSTSCIHSYSDQNLQAIASCGLCCQEFSVSNLCLTLKASPCLNFKLWVASDRVFSQQVYLAMGDTMDAEVEALCADVWAWRLAESPELATFCGFHHLDDLLDDVSEEAYIKREVYLPYMLFVCIKLIL